MNYATDVSPIVVDLETAGLPNAADFLEPVIPDARLKDPEKIAADIIAKTEARQQKLALDWNVGRIVALGWWTNSGGDQSYLACQDEWTERYAITNFWEWAKRRTIVGFNVKAFDLRFLVQRSRYLGIPHPDVDFGKYSRKGVHDLYLDLTFNDGTYDQGAMRRTLHAFCRRFGIPVDDSISGKEIPALVEAGEWEQIQAHVTSDVLLTVALAERLGVIRVEVAA
jgi:predicted PolB exonuclease-like 3'-5' exonuclease